MVLGLDLERRHPAGGYTEEPLYVSGPEADPVDAARWAIQVLAENASADDLLLITWE